MNSFVSLKTSKQTIFLVCFSMCLFYAFHAMAQSDLYNRLSRAERDIETLSKSVYKGQKLPDSMVSGIDEDQKFRAQLDVRMADLETQIRELRGQIEQMQFNVDTLNSKIQSMATQQPSQQLSQSYQGQVVQPQPTTTTQGGNTLSNIVVTQQATGSALGSNNVVSSQAQNLSASAQPTEVYEKAFSLLKAGDNPGAQKGFSDFIAQYPDDKLTDNARYWLGETYYVQNQYEQAARIFAEAYQKAPKGAKAPDNLLKLGLSLSGLGRQDDACVSLGQLDKAFGATSSAIVRRGEQERAKLGC